MSTRWDLEMPPIPLAVSQWLILETNLDIVKKR